MRVSEVRREWRRVSESEWERRERRGGKREAHSHSLPPRKEIATTEIQQFTNVLSHPAFRNNPLAALRAHLTNSQDQERDNQKKLNAIAGVKPQRKQKKKTKKK